MHCDHWRGKLETYADGELSLPESNALADHMRECSACAAAALDRVQLKRSVATAARRYQASAEFRSKVMEKFSPQPSHGTGLFWKILVLPAALTLIFVFGLNLYLGRAKSEREHVYSELADLHVATLASTNPVDVISTDRHTVKPWFEGKVPFTFNLPELQATDFTLVGARVTYLSQRPGAQLLFRIRKHLISAFIFMGPASGNAALSGAIQVRSFNFEDWTQNGLRFFVVGDVGANDIDALSRLLHEAN